MKVIIFEKENFRQHIQEILEQMKDSKQIRLGGSIIPGFEVANICTNTVQLWERQ